MNAAPRDRARAARIALLTATAVAAGLPGCVSPLAGRGEPDLRRSVIASVRRETAAAAEHAGTRRTEREPGIERLGIRPELMPELERMAGPDAYEKADLPISTDLTGQAPASVMVSLERAVRTAAANNLQVQFQRLAPGISEAQAVAAEAAFDWVLFGEGNWASNDQERQTVPFSGLQSTIDQRQVYTLRAGLRRSLITGGQFTIQQDLEQTDVNTPGLSIRPNPGDAVGVTVRYDQPLLRGFGSDVALAQVRLSRNAERDQIARLKTELIRTVTETEVAYWQLVQAHRDLLILRRLLERGIETQDKVVQRERLDATPAQIYNARSQVETRRANILIAQNTFRDAGERLKSLMNDPDLPVGSEVLIVPADDPIDAPIEFSLLDSLTRAVRHRPEVEQAILSIDDTSIRRVVADNARLPQLDLRLQARFGGLDNNFGEAYTDVAEGSFIDYLAGLIFEVPLGNRAREAQYVQRRLEQSQAVLAYRNTVQSIAGEVKRFLRAVETNYRLIEQRKVARLAATEDLRSFKIGIELVEGLGVQNLDLLLRRQESLAQAERDEVAARTDYMTAIARLHAAMGTALERNRILFVVPDAPVERR
jgi:outer membrane protein